MERIKDLYYQYFANRPEYAELTELPDVIEADNELRECIMSKLAGAWSLEDIEHEIYALKSANEMQGFIYGYMYAMQMLVACGVKVGDVA